MNDVQKSQPSRELVAVSAVIAALALPIYATAVFFDAWDARVVSLYVGSVVLVIAAGTLFYAKRPRAFGSRTCGDPLRTQYRQPPVRVVPAAAPPAVTVRTPVWTRDYTRLVVAQSALVALALTINICLAVGVTLALSRADNPAFFIAAVLVLGLFFAISGRLAVGEAALTPTDATPRRTPDNSEGDVRPSPRDPVHPHAA